MSMLPLRRRPTTEIKLLRVGLIPRGHSLSEGIGTDWNHAQPEENLSPEKAAQALQIEVWEPMSVVKRRYRVLQMRYPSDQFTDQHVEWRPSAELLGEPKHRLNWYWASGLIPSPTSTKSRSADSLWDAESVESILSAEQVLDRLL